MPTRKIADLPPGPCTDSEHNPPTMMLWEPGIYEHTCPRCGAKVRFCVERPSMSTGGTGGIPYPDPGFRAPMDSTTGGD